MNRNSPVCIACGNDRDGYGRCLVCEDVRKCSPSCDRTCAGPYTGHHTAHIVTLPLDGVTRDALDVLGIAFETSRWCDMYAALRTMTPTDDTDHHDAARSIVLDTLFYLHTDALTDCREWTYTGDTWTRD